MVTVATGTLKPDPVPPIYVLSAVRTSAPKYFDGNIASKSLTEIVQDLYSNVGVYHANRVYRDLRKEEKGFGFNPDFINFVTNYFRKHLVETITLGAVKTMRDFFLPLISKAVTDGATFEEIAQAIPAKSSSNNNLLWIRFSTLRTTIFMIDIFFKIYFTIPVTCLTEIPSRVNSKIH